MPVLLSCAVKVYCRWSAFIALGTKENVNLVLFSLWDVYLHPDGRRNEFLSRKRGQSWSRSTFPSTEVLCPSQEGCWVLIISSRRFNNIEQTISLLVRQNQKLKGVASALANDEGLLSLVSNVYLINWKIAEWLVSNGKSESRFSEESAVLLYSTLKASSLKSQWKQTRSNISNILLTIMLVRNVVWILRNTAARHELLIIYTQCNPSKETALRFFGL